LRAGLFPAGRGCVGGGAGSNVGRWGVTGLGRSPGTAPWGDFRAERLVSDDSRAAGSGHTDRQFPTPASGGRPAAGGTDGLPDDGCVSKMQHDQL
ncbi:MAG: hypothetical protein ACUVR2_12915, partial [Anaerolineae bacterium]